jgi:hypothetical protein
LSAAPDALDVVAIAPHVVPPHAPPVALSVQVTPPLFPSLSTLAVIGMPVVLPAVAFAVCGVTFTEIGGVTVIVAALDLLPSATEVAVSVTGKVAAAAAGAVYVMAVPEMLEVAERLPQVVVPVHVTPGEDSTQVTPALFTSLVTVAVNGIPVGLLAAMFAVCGATLTAMAGVTIIVAKLDTVEVVTEVAVSVTLKLPAVEAGAVYVMDVLLALDAADILPQGVGPVPVQVLPGDESDQFTPPILGSLLTVGVNVIPVGLLASAFAVWGATVTARFVVSVIVAVADGGFGFFEVVSTTRSVTVLGLFAAFTIA